MSQLQIVTKTSILNNRLLQLETQIVNPETGLVHDARLKVLDLEEEAIRRALIELGWTPPKKET